MNDNIHFLIDGSILRQVLTTLKSGNEYIYIAFFEDKIVLSTQTIYTRIPASILNQYHYVPGIPILSVNSGFEYSSTLPNKKGTEVSVDILSQEDNVEEYTIKIGLPGPTMSTQLIADDDDFVMREQVSIGKIDATIVIHDIKLFSQILRKSVGHFYVGAVGTEIRVGTHISSYIAFTDEHRGVDFNTILHRRTIKLKKMGFAGAESIIIDIDIEHNKMLYKWISNKVLYIALFPYLLS